MLTSSLSFPTSVEQIQTGTASVIAIYTIWFQSLQEMNFHSKTEFFDYFDESEKWDLQLESYDFMQYVHPDKDIRDAALESSRLVSEFGNKWSMNLDIYNTISIFNEQYKNSFDKEETLYMSRTMDAYKHKGIHLGKEHRDALENINQQMTVLGLEYSAVLNNNADFVMFTRQELDGVDDDFIDSLDTDDDTVLKHKVTTKYDHINKVMPYCNVETTRKTLSEKVGNVGKSEGNHDRLQKMLELRKTKASILGYDNYAQYVLSYRRMATSPTEVNTFLDGMVGDLQGASQSDADGISEHFGKEKMESWNLGYYSNKYKKEVLNLDQKLIQTYFPLETLLPKLLGTFEEIFHLRITDETENIGNTQSWHSSVKCYCVHDDSVDGDGGIIGHFFVDLYPREGKYGHAAAFTIKSAYMENGVRSTPISAMVCNFSRPTKEKPSLLTFGEVETFFHELGHIFHQLMSKNRFSMFSGTAVERDFVECPSQALENWCYEKDFLTRISHKYDATDDNTVMPDDIIIKIKANKHLFNGLHYIRQLTLAKYDMNLHTSTEYIDVVTSFKTVQDELSPLIHIDNCMAANFGHMMGGYESGYYGYIWSEAYASEVFNLFKESGNIFDKEIGLHYRQCILEKGGTESGFHMMKQLLGRDPNSDAFLSQFRTTETRQVEQC